MAAATSLAEAIRPVRILRTRLEGDFEAEVAGWQMSSIWHETGAQKDLGVIRRETSISRSKLQKMVISGPMFYCGKPILQDAEVPCAVELGLRSLDLDYYTRKLFPYGLTDKPICRAAEVSNLLPRCRWDPTLSHVDFFRVAFRNMINLNSERSLVGALISPGTAHINTCRKHLAFGILKTFLFFTALSLRTYDFIIKASGRRTPFMTEKLDRFRSSTLGKQRNRGLRLACLTTAYADLWNEHAHTLSPLPWHSADPRLRSTA